MKKSAINPSTISYIAGAPLEYLEGMTFSERFKLIHSLTAYLFNQAAQYNRTQFATPTPHDFPEEYEALTKLSLSFSHSKSFNRLIINSADLTLEKIKEDSPLLNTLRTWKKASHIGREKSLVKIIHHFIESCSALSNINFSVPLISFSHEGKDKEGDLSQGYYFNIRSTSHGYGKIDINTHRSAGYYKVTTAAAVALHEGVHAVQDQLVIIGERTPTKIKDYAHDCRLGTLLAKHDALIPWKLDGPYRVQSHERLAYSADERFGKKLELIL